MSEINEALKQLLLKIITTISSTKFWFCLIGMVAAGYFAYQAGGLNGALVAVLAFLGIPTVYTVTKTQQNIGLAKAGLTDSTRFKNGTGEANPKDISNLWVFNVVDFHTTNLNTVAQSYGVSNPATIFYNSERLAQGIDADNWENAKLFWEYNSQLAKDMYIFVHGEDIEECNKKILSQKPTCSGWDLASHCKTKGMPDYVALLKLQRAEENNNNVKELFGDCAYTLYMAGEMARYL